MDCTAAFDLATSWLEKHPQDRDATELATLSAECADAAQPRMAEVTLRLLATAGSRPGFAEEPGLGDGRLVTRGESASDREYPLITGTTNGEQPR